MIHLHYEMFNISAKAAEAMGLDSTQMVKLKFTSNKSTVKLQTSDFNHFKATYLSLLKQIPAGKRKYDATDNVWTIPAAAFDVIKQLIEHHGGTQAVLRHKDLYADFILATDKNNNSKNQKVWHETVREQDSFQAEAAEDFFHAHTISVDTQHIGTIQNKLLELIKPFMPMPEDETELTREWFMRGYKIAARRYHPDIKGGDAQKMSELNSLWMQYKEMA